MYVCTYPHCAAGIKFNLCRRCHLLQTKDIIWNKENKYTQINPTYCNGTFKANAIVREIIKLCVSLGY